jgi:hypothetical protein
LTFAFRHPEGNGKVDEQPSGTLITMTISIEALWTMPVSELMTAYYDARRAFVERKFTRDSQRARLEWLRAKAFMTGIGGVSERRTAVDASEELGRKGQELREMTRDLDLLKVDFDVIAMIVRLRGAAAGAEPRGEAPGDEEPEGGG